MTDTGKNASDAGLTFTELEIDALQEVMNISFGSAAADLSDIIDIFIHLNVPEIKVIKASELADYIKSEIRDFEMCSMVEQTYNGDFHGIAFLIFPYGVERELMSYFHDPDIQLVESDEIIELETEVLMEIGNILIGACIGKIFELLQSRATYFPPRSIVGERFQDLFLKGHFGDKDIVMTMKTNFSFQDRNASGFMFLLNSQDSISYLKKALLKFLGIK